MRRFLSGIWTKVITITDLPVNLTDGANKQYVDSKLSPLLRFYLANGTQSCIPLSNGKLTFYLSDGTQSDIPIGC